MKEEFKQAVIAARKLVLQYKRRNGNELAHPLRIDPTTIPGWGGGSKILGYIEVAAEVWRKPIVVESFSELGVPEPLDACFLNYEDHVEIMVKRGKRYCWQRFLVAKELCHLLIGNAQNITPLNFEDVSRLISDLLNDHITDIKPDVVAEYLAYIAAIELLFPSEFIQDADRMLNSGASIMDVAERYKVPRMALEYRLQRKDIRELYDEIYSSPEYKHINFQPVIS